MRSLVVAFSLITLACAFQRPSFFADVPVQGRHSQRSVEGSCSTYTIQCVNPGGNCTYSDPANIPTCLEGRCADGLCPNVATYQQSCATVQCINSLLCHPVTQVCVKQTDVKPPGASCSSNSQCLYSYGSNAVSTCTSGVCQGTALGASCSGPNQCSGRAYCNSNGVCASLLGLGASCSSSDTTIYAGVCNSGTVITPGTVAAGGTCTEDSACNDGLYCSGNTVSSGVCTVPKNGALCNANSDCADGEICICDGTHANTTCLGSYVSPAGTTAAILNYARCIDSHNCIEGDFACSTNNCASSYCAYRTIAINQVSQSGCIYDYLRTQLNDIVPAITCPSSASQHFVSFGLAAFVLAVALLL